MKNWKIVYVGYKPGEEPLREALCTTGNGYFATRGAIEGCTAGEIHYPGTYLAGGYNRLDSEIADRVITNEDLVNWPDWTVLKCKPENGQWLDPDRTQLISFKTELDLKEGILERTLEFEDELQRRTEIRSLRFVSMRDPHRAAIEWTVTPKNWSGRMVVHAALDGTVINSGVARYRALNSRHHELVKIGESGEDVVFIQVAAVQSELQMAQAARTRVFTSSVDLATHREVVKEEKYIAHELTFDVEENKPARIEKTVAVYTSRDSAISSPAEAANTSVMRASDFSSMKKEHVGAWEDVWQRCDTILESDHDQDQLLLRFHIFHLAQTCSEHTIDLDVGIPARGWHGEAYRGHIFWDELFIFPFLSGTFPELTRALLMYRYRRLDEARYAAVKAGHCGAMFPWQSGSSGREESQVIHLNPESGRWLPDNTFLQRHVNAAIAYNVWHHFQVSGDLEFLSSYGAELLMSVARFWCSLTHFSETTQRYEIHGVVGPDEYHTAYPGATEQGLRNNAYTNIMAVWSIKHALEAMHRIDGQRAERLKNKLGISSEETDRWEKITRLMYIPFIRNGKVIEQFEGFDQLEELDWEHYHGKYGEVLRLDRVLEKEGDKVDRYKAAKQADVLMLFYLMSADELTALFEQLGYAYDVKRHLADNITYYEKITSHGSTLSKLIHSWVYARSRRKESWHSFKKALLSDFEDIQGGTTPEGIHLGAMAGTVDLIRRCYTGMEFREEALWFDPHLPENVKRISFRLIFKDHWLEVDLTQKKLSLLSHGGFEDQITVVVKGRKSRLKKGQRKNFRLSEKN